MKTPAVAFVTGAARRVGAAIATELHRVGLNIVLHYRTSQAAAELLALQLNAERPGSVVLLQANLSDPPKVLETLVNDAKSAWGRLDILVNNASCFYSSPFSQSTIEMWDDLMTVNARAPFFLSQAMAPHLAKHQGCIVNIGDIHGLRPLKNYGIYCQSKAALLMQTKSLARELAPHVRVNAVSPSVVAWPEGVNTLSETQKDSILRQVPLQRLGTPEDIAKAVRFLALEALYMTGFILTVDGGRSLSVISEMSQ